MKKEIAIRKLVSFITRESFSVDLLSFCKREKTGASDQHLTYTGKYDISSKVSKGGVIVSDIIFYFQNNENKSSHVQIDFELQYFVSKFSRVFRKKYFDPSIARLFIGIKMKQSFKNRHEIVF